MFVFSFFAITFISRVDGRQKWYTTAPHLYDAGDENRDSQARDGPQVQHLEKTSDAEKSTQIAGHAFKGHEFGVCNGNQSV